MNWLEDDFSNYGVVQLDSVDPPPENLTLKSPPESQPEQKFTIKQGFQIDTSLVVLRLRKAIWTLKSENFFENSLPDLYTPFWIVTTLVLVISATSAMTTHNISTLITSATVFYTIGIVIPGVLFCMLSSNGSSMQYYYIVSIYGYSLVHFFIPCAVSFLLNWVLSLSIWTIAAVLSLIFLKKNLWDEIEKFIPNQKILAIGVIVAGHLLLVLSTNIYRYKAS